MSVAAAGRQTLAPGSVALITGGSQGIGEGIALRLARDGYDIAVNDIPSKSSQCEDLVSRIRALGRKAIVVLADVSKEAETDRMVAEVVKGLGRLDCCVANAGIADIKPLLETTQADRDRVLSVNGHGLMNTYISAAKQMIKQGHGGRIIGASSITAFNSSPQLGSYVFTKYGVRGFTGVAAKEWAQYGIRVNAYAPGFIDTPLAIHLNKLMPQEQSTITKEDRDKWMRDATLLKRLGVPDDCGKLISFLASDDAEYITGQTFKIDGGVVVD